VLEKALEIKPVKKNGKRKLWGIPFIYSSEPDPKPEGQA
jgi:hypothetical protein